MSDTQHLHIDTREICSACGTSFVNHKFLLISNTIDGTIGRIYDLIFGFTSGGSFMRRVTATLERFLQRIALLVGIIRYSDDIDKSLTGRSRIVWEEARARGIPMQQIVALGKPLEYHRALINGKWFYFQSLPIPFHLPQSGYQWIDSKFTLFQRLSAAGIPFPNTQKVFTLSAGKKALKEIGDPVIIKPVAGSRGRHTTTNINTDAELTRAFSLIRQITPWIIVQKHLSGNVCRATVINNELVGFFKAEAPTVVGDGGKTIRELVQEKNSKKGETLSEILINSDLTEFIARQSYTLESKLSAGTSVNLSAKTGRMYGGKTREMLDEIHPKMHDIFKKAARVINAPVLGFDLIIEDPTSDPDTQNWGIIECNSEPYIDLHYFALEGPRRNLAKNVWDLWQK